MDRNTKRIVRLGVTVPSSRTVLEPLTSRIISSTCLDDLSISVKFSRFRVTKIDLSPDATKQFELHSILIAANFLADAKMDVVGWSGTSTGWLGFRIDQSLCVAVEAETGIQATTSTLSLIQRLQSLGAQSLGLVTPYVKE